MRHRDHPDSVRMGHVAASGRLATCQVLSSTRRNPWREGGPPRPPWTSRTERTHRRVLVVDDHPAFRHALSSALSLVADIEVAGEAGGGVAACTEAEELDPDIVIMDLSMPDLSGIDAMKRIHERRPDLPVVDLDRARGRRRGARSARGRRLGVPREGHRAARPRGRAARSRRGRRRLAAGRRVVAVVAHEPAQSQEQPLGERGVVQQRLEVPRDERERRGAGRRSHGRRAHAAVDRSDLAEVAARADSVPGYAVPETSA